MNSRIVADCLEYLFYTCKLAMLTSCVNHHAALARKSYLVHIKEADAHKCVRAQRRCKLEKDYLSFALEFIFPPF